MCSVPRTYNQDLGFAKIDWQPNDRNSVQLRPERDALGLAARHPDAGRADERQPARQQRQLHRGRPLRQGFLDVRSEQQLRSTNSALAGSRTAFPTRPRAIFGPSTGPIYITVAGSTVGAAAGLSPDVPSENRYPVRRQL